MRHGLPHPLRIPRGMLLLLLPLRAFGHGRAGKLVDRAVSAGTLDDPIATRVDHSRHLAVTWYIFATVPGVPLRIDLGGDGHAANLQHRRHATLRNFHAVPIKSVPRQWVSNFSPPATARLYVPTASPARLEKAPSALLPRCPA